MLSIITSFRICAAGALTALVGAGAHPAVGHITSGGSMHVPRASHSSTLLPNGTVLIAGGFGGSGTESHPYTSSELFDPRDGSFIVGPSMRVGRSGHTATLLGNGTVLMAGGWTGTEDARATAEIYDPSTNRFTATGSMVVGRGGQTATLLPDGRVLIAGGADRNDDGLASAELYDPASGRFTPTGKMTIARDGPTATLLRDGRVLIAGGSSASRRGKTVYRSAELFDPATAKFTATGEMAVPRHKHAAALLPTGMVLVVGGSDDRDWHGEYATAELYDPARGTFSSAGAMSLERFKLGSAVVLVDNGNLLVAGGAARAELYDPGARNFRLVDGTLGAARYYASAIALRDGRALITGGYADEPGRGLPSTAQAFLYTK